MATLCLLAKRSFWILAQLKLKNLNKIFIIDKIQNDTSKKHEGELSGIPVSSAELLFLVLRTKKKLFIIL